jgi:bifunctional ADP-heptose synthase (sugar kinase/adenylyltransferase)
VDTRTKIISNEEARGIANATIVSGFFDPITNAHAERLRGLKQAGQPLLVLIATPANSILPSEARAVLVAGLACVDHVTIIGAVYPDDLTPHTQLETEDAERLEQLIRHVQARQQAAQGQQQQ